MKNIIKRLIFIAFTGIVFSACNYDDTNFDQLTKKPDPNATYYLQFKSGSTLFKTDLDANDIPANVSTSIVVGLLGMPLSQDLTVNLEIDPSTTMQSSMYNLSSTSVTIAAGTTTGSISLTTNSILLPIDETLKLVINLDAGANTATAGTTLVYEFFRPAPCKPVPGVYRVEMHDDYGDGWQTDNGDGGSGITVDVDGVIQEIGMCSPYLASSFTCSEGSTDATGYITIPEGAVSAKWFFPGDWWGEISFEIYDPSGALVLKVNTGEGTAGELPVRVCL